MRVIKLRKPSTSTNKPWMCDEKGCVARRYKDKNTNKLDKKCIGHKIVVE